jgi:hypothetical protein
MSDARKLEPGEPRSSGTITKRRVLQPWPKDRRLRILSIDGGGIRGIFPATILAGLERAYTGGSSIGNYFDLVAGTSTGGILALGLGAGYSANELLELYTERGCEVFPPFPDNKIGRLRAKIRSASQYAHYLYDRSALTSLLSEELGEKTIGDSRVRLCIPAFEGQHSEVFVYKTPHHPDYKTDRFETMVSAALATSAAPTYFRPLEHNSYVLVDGGVWANNPVMIALIEALTCFDIPREQIDILTIGCGNDPYVVSSAEIKLGGIWHWKRLILAAMRLQAMAATNQARLLVGFPSVIRLEAPVFQPTIALDDWRGSMEKLLPAAEAAVAANGEVISEVFLQTAADQYVPFPPT